MPVEGREEQEIEDHARPPPPSLSGSSSTSEFELGSMSTLLTPNRLQIHINDPLKVVDLEGRYRLSIESGVTFRSLVPRGGSSVRSENFYVGCFDNDCTFLAQ